MGIYRNDRELKQALQKAIQGAVDYVVDRIWRENRELVRKIVYEAGLPEDYHRSNEFKDAWDYKSKTSSSADASASFFYKPEEMSVGSLDKNSNDYGQHIAIANGKSVSAGDDAREYLADIIYQGIKDGSAWGPKNHWSHKRRNAFKALLESVGKQKFDQWFKEGARKYGLDVKKSYNLNK